MDIWSLGACDLTVIILECLNAHRDLDRNARHFFPGLYQEQVWAPKRQRSNSSILVIDAQEDKATSSTPCGEVGKLLTADAAVGMVGTGRKRRKTQRALEADVGPVRYTRGKSAANADKENLPQKNGRSGRVAPEEAASQQLQGTTSGTTRGTTRGTTSGRSRRAPRQKRGRASYADLRADAKMLAIPPTTAISRRTQAELAQAIVDHVPQMTVAQLIQACHKKRLSLETLPRAPRKKDYVALLVHHYTFG